MLVTHAKYWQSWHRDIVLHSLYHTDGNVQLMLVTHAKYWQSWQRDIVLHSLYHTDGNVSLC